MMHLLMNSMKWNIKIQMNLYTKTKLQNDYPIFLLSDKTIKVHVLIESTALNLKIFLLSFELLFKHCN